MATKKVIIYKGKLYFSDVTVPTRVSQLANDTGYVTTDENVKQTPTTEDAIYRILLSGDADDTEHVNKVFKNANLTYNPSTSQLELSKSYIGNILANVTADPKYLTIQQYVNNVSIGYLQLNFNDIYNDNKWDGTNTSLKSAIGNVMIKSITLSKLYTATLTTKSGVVGGYVGEVNLTDVPSKCVLILPLGNARCASDGGRYGVVGSYSPSNLKNTRWFINGPTNETYNVYFVYFCTFN